MPGLILGIETSNPSSAPAGPERPGVALARQGSLELVAVEPIDTSRPTDDDLMPAIDRLFLRANARPKDLAAVAVSVGPGGYTAVRVAVTVAKMIAEATGAACLPVPTAQVVAQRVNANQPFAVALASKGDSALLTVFDAARQPAPGRLAKAQDLDKLGIRLLIADQFFPEDMRRRCAELGIEARPPIFDPLACIEASKTVAPVDPSQLLPLYPREPEAVTKWKQLHPPAP